jgi:hypothetical protein
MIVRQWTQMSGLDRRLCLEAAHMIYTEQQEIMKGLKGERSREPFLY